MTAIEETFKRKVFRVELFAVDGDGFDERGVRDYLENLRHLNAQVMAIESRDVDWHDGHPLNNSKTAPAEFARMFSRLAELEKAEPVAWRYRSKEHDWDDWTSWRVVTHKPQGPASELFEFEPLYTHPAAAPPFARDSWQHAVDDHLSALGRTSQEFASSHEALAWLLSAHAQIVHDLAEPATAPQVPDGWQMVPKVPTPEMTHAAAMTPGIRAIDNSSAIMQLRGYPLDKTAFLDGSPLEQAWRAMLSAAPKEPTHSDGVGPSDGGQEK